MTIQEFSTEFDILFNNVTSNQAPGLNEYEKSVFLTKAQSQLVNEYFNNRTDGVGGGFDGSQRRQYDFSNLIRVEKLYNVNTFKERIDATEKLDKRSLVYLFPQNYYLAVNEILADKKYQYSVTPLSYAEYQRLMLKPYNFPVKRGAWRLMGDKKNFNIYTGIEDSFDEDNNPIKVDTGYRFQTSWAENRRTLALTIISTSGPLIENPWDPTDDLVGPVEIAEISYKLPNGSTVHPKVIVGNDTITFCSLFNGRYDWRKVVVSRSYGNTDPLEVSITIDNASGIDDIILNDRDAIALAKDSFIFMNYYIKERPGELSDVPLIASYVDGMQAAVAPFDNIEFQTMDGNPATLVGKTITTEVTVAPLVEIIGKFSGEPDYQLRYISKLSPIVLDDLSNYGTDLTIGGITDITECQLPEETHQEILERAVTLAKIAWQGGTATQAAAEAQKSKN